MRSTLAAWVYYRGDLFRGYQRQVEGPTVQQTLTEALTQAGVETTLFCAGRTDKGVHARMQVVCFRAPEELAPEELKERLAPLLPPSLGVCFLRRAHRSFHAQWRCTQKEYRYRIALGPVPERLAPFVWRPERPFAPELLSRLLSRAEGTRDFWAFHEKSSVRKPRTLQSAKLVEVLPGIFEARLVGDGFARYQVRYLLGSSVLTAQGALDEGAYVSALDEAKEIAGLKAPAEGLALWQVYYPAEIDPFTSQERGAPAGLPDQPPYAFG